MWVVGTGGHRTPAHSGFLVIVRVPPRAALQPHHVRNCALHRIPLTCAIPRSSRWMALLHTVSLLEVLPTMSTLLVYRWTYLPQHWNVLPPIVHTLAQFRC